MNTQNSTKSDLSVCPVCGRNMIDGYSDCVPGRCGYAHEMAIKRGETIGILENTLRQKEAMWIKQDEEIERLKGVIDMYLEWCPGCCLFDKFIKPKLKKCNLQQTTKEEK